MATGRALKSRSLAESLPDEVLERIFSYCSLTDLLVSFRNVSTQWRRVSQAPGLWKYVIFNDCNQSHTSVVQVLVMSRSIQAVIFTKVRYSQALYALTECSLLRTVLFSDFQVLSTKFLKALQANCPKIEYLRLPIHVITVPRLCEAVGKFSNLKVLELGRMRLRTDSPIILKPLAVNCPHLVSLNFWDNKFQMKELQQFLDLKKNTLRYLGVACSNIDKECVLPLLSDLPRLKSLHLYSFELCELRAKGEKLCNLKNLTSLTFEEALRIEIDDILELFRSKKLAHLKYVTLRGFYLFNNNLSDAITQNCPLLKRCRITSF